MTAPPLLVPLVPEGWVALTGPGSALLALLAPDDERLPHLSAALDSGRFDDALFVLGRSGPPTAVAACVVGPALRVVTSLGGHAEALVGGRRREIRSDPNLGWADVTLHDVASIALLAPAEAVTATELVATPSIPASPSPVPAPLPTQAPPPAPSPGPSLAPPPAPPPAPPLAPPLAPPAAPIVVPTVDPVPAATPPGGTRPIIDHLPWLTSPAAAAPPPPAPPAPPAPVEPAAATITLPVAPAQPGGWVPGAAPAPVSRTYTPYAVPLSPVTAALPEPQPEPEREPTPEPAPEQEPEPAPEPELTQVLAGAATVVLPAVTAYRPVDPADDPEAFDATVDRSTLWGAEVPHAPSGVSVLAVLCPAGHVSPPHASTCRTCGRDVPAQEPFSTPRPPLGVLRLSTGDLVTLDRGVLLGRAPQVDPDQPVAQRPHVVRVASPQRDVSRTHLEVVLEGWHVLVRDLATTNGTTVTLPGREPVRLLPHDQQVIEPGTLVSLADEVTFTFEIAG